MQLTLNENEAWALVNALTVAGEKYRDNHKMLGEKNANEAINKLGRQFLKQEAEVQQLRQQVIDATEGE